MKISFLGDIMCDMNQLKYCKTNEGYDFVKPLKTIAEELSDSDLIVANLETPVAGADFGYTNHPYSFNAPTDLADALKEVGVGIVQTANNHCLDRGVNGLQETLKNLDNAGLQHIGTHAKLESSYLIIEEEGVKVGFLGFTYGTNAFENNNYLNEKNSYMVDLLQRQELSGRFERFFYKSQNKFMIILRIVLHKILPGLFKVPIHERRQSNKEEKAYLKKTIMDCRDAGADYIVACLHIGGQYHDNPTEYTLEICEYCRKLGVNAVLANHEHVIHYIENKHMTQQYFCAYSLGNFWGSTGVCQEPYDKFSNYSVVYNIDIEKKENQISAKYNFMIFITHLAVGGLITELLYQYIIDCKDEREAAEQEKINNLLINRIFQTEGISYPLQREYNINPSGLV